MRLEKKTISTLLIVIFMMSVFVVAVPVIGAYPPYWVKASGGGGFYNDDPDHYGDHCTIGLTGMSLSAVERGEETEYKGSGVFVDHGQEMVVHLGITSGRWNPVHDGHVDFYGTARVKDLELREKWTGTFALILGYDEYGDRFAINLFNEDGHFVGNWVGVLEDGEVTVWIWE